MSFLGRYLPWEVTENNWRRQEPTLNVRFRKVSAVKKVKENDWRTEKNGLCLIEAKLSGERLESSLGDRFRKVSAL